jgi:hypothetical protein
MKTKHEAKNTKKPERKLRDLPPRKDARGGEIVISKPTDTTSPK